MSFRTLALVASIVVSVAACGPAAKHNGGGDGGGDTCNPGDHGDCYDGQPGTEGVGLCHGGTRECTAQGLWTQCEGEIVPVGEVCGDGLDNNCNGSADEDVDSDGDGFTTCGGDCCDSTECSNPKAVNPGAFEAAGDGVDNDCDGMIDNAVPLCDSGLQSNSSAGMDYAKAIDLCQTTTMTDKKWGVISATLTKADGTGTAPAKGHSIRAKYGTGVMPHAGSSLVLLATGAAASVGDTNPAYDDLENGMGAGVMSSPPADFLSANGGMIPNLAGCPGPLLGDTTANSPQMLTLKIRVPSNANSFTLDTNFFSSEFPEFTCSPYNDFFVVLLDSTYAGTPANPTDKNLAFYSAMGNTMKFPVGVNLAYGNTGLFTECVNGGTGCQGQIFGGHTGSINTCTSTTELTGTGLDTPASGNCDNNALEGGATGWLKTTGNVKPGEVITLRIAIWNVSDDALQSLAVLDNFKWSVDTSDPGTVIFRK